MDKFVQKVKHFSIKAHNSVNHKYGKNKNYSFHLDMVYEFGETYIYLMPVELQKFILASCFAHDRIEDCRETYNDLVKYCGEEVADIVYAVTDEKGRNRAERKPKKLYDEMLYNMSAVYVKLCDRLANMKYSKEKYDLMTPEQKKASKKSMYMTYCKEHTDFKKKLYLSSNMREMFKVVGFKESLKAFKHFNVKDILVSTIKNKEACLLEPLWNHLETMAGNNI
jgi:(p)ppGpp synthase/HD superfamily hydrolase